METELWDSEELLSIIKYEPSKRKKAILSLFWDAKNHAHSELCSKSN
ncbi:MAG TPA: hypothetical protein VFD60_13555 [Nitrososphaeraceae archaeon]|nr:hypothetical protein [Nitrososphaeraceae archaeon]